MQSRQISQQTTQKGFIQSQRFPIGNNLSSLQQYLLRHGISHTLSLGNTARCKKLLQRMDFLQKYERIFGLDMLSYYWYLVDPQEKGSSYDSTFTEIWNKPPTRITTQRILVLLHLFETMKWNESITDKLQHSLTWLSPHQSKFSHTFRSLQKIEAFHTIGHGNMMEGTEKLELFLENSQNTAQQILRRFLPMIKDTASITKTEMARSLLEELRTLPPQTPNRFHVEKILIPFAFRTLEEKEKALEELEAIIPHQGKNATEFQMQVYEQYFDIYIDAKLYTQAIEYGKKILESSHDISRINRLKLEIQMQHCYVHTQPIEISLAKFEQLEANQHSTDPSYLKEWDIYLLALALQAVKYYAEKKDTHTEYVWQQRIVQVRRNKHLDTLRMCAHMKFEVPTYDAQQLALALYQQGVILEKMQQPAQAHLVFVESVEIFSSIHTPTKPLSTKQLANALWKAYNREDTIENRAHVEKCLLLRESLPIDEKLQYSIIFTRNTLGIWAMEREEWHTAKKHVQRCRELLIDLLKNTPNNTTYTKGLHKTTIRLAWIHLHLGNVEIALMLSKEMEASPLLNLDTVYSMVEKWLQNLG